MEEMTTWKTTERPGLDDVNRNGSTDLPDIGHRAQVLKNLAVALLKEVQTLGSAGEHENKETIDFYDEVRRFEIELIRRALSTTGGHQVRAARLLNVKVTTLNSKIKRFNINPEVQVFGHVPYEVAHEGLHRRA